MTKEKKILLSYLLKQYLLQKKIPKDVIEIFSNNSHLYLKKIDKDNVALSFDVNFINSPQSRYSIDKLKNKPFYDDVVDWINNNKNINGNKY